MNLYQNDERFKERMSILQEYQEHERILGKKIIQKIDEYLKICHESGREIFYDDVVYKREEFERFEKWLKSSDSE